MAIVVIAVPMQALQFTPAEWNLQTSLPLQLCDWGWLAATVALWSRSRLAATLTYLWGLTLTTQAIATPALTTPYPGLRWWMFWALHLLIVWAAVHVIWGMKIHPTWTTYWQAVLITFAWLFATFRFNVIVGTNYGYLNGKPPQGSALDLLLRFDFAAGFGDLRFDDVDFIADVNAIRDRGCLYCLIRPVRTRRGVRKA